MLPLRANLPSTALALLLVAQTAHADLTPQDVWEDWRTYITGLGNEITADESVSGDTLTVSNLRMTMNMPEDQGTGVVNLGTLSFTGMNDGTVDITIPETMPIMVAMTPAQGDDVAYQVDFVQTGYQMTASGTPTNMEYSYSANSMGLILQELVVNGTPVRAEDASFTANLFDIAGTTRMTIAALRSYDQTISADRMEIDVAAIAPEDEGKFAISAQSEGISFAGTGTIPLALVQSADMSKMLEAGFSIDGAFQFGAGRSTLQSDGPDGAVAAATTSTGGTVGVKMSSEGLTYDVSQTGLTVDMQAAAAPFPINFAMEQSNFKLTMPLTKSEEPRDFALGLTLGEFTMSDMLWGIFDPTSELPRNPATVILDLTGKARLLFDFLDPSAAAVTGNPNLTPAEVEALNINKLQVTVAGAELTGEGAFTFENPPTGGMPKPNGAVDLKLVGGNGLLDKLVAIGILPEDQAMGARMMMGLFAVPAEGEDTLTSKIEVNEEGHVIANGQRIQ